MNNAEVMREIEKAEQKKISTLSEENRQAIIIQETIYLGKINNKDLFRLAELDNRDNYSSMIYKYFDENARLQGVKNVRNDGEKEWVYTGEELEQIKDEIDKNEAQLEEEIEEILAELGISEKDIENITEVDLEQEIKEKEEQDQEDEELEEENEEEGKEEQEEQKENKKDDKKEENESEQTSRYTNVLNEVDTSKRIDQKGTTLGKALGLDKYGYTTLKVIHADNLSDIKDKDGKHLKAGTKKIAILGVREEEGKKVVEKIPEDVLDYYQGVNNSSVRFDDNDEVEKNTKTYERFVNPKTNRGIAIEKGEMETKVYYQSGIDRDDNTAVMERVEDGRTGWINAETKEIFNSNHGIYQQDKVNEEMKQHEEDKGEEIYQENADGNLNTASGHIHEIDVTSEIVYDGRLMSVQEVAQMPRFKMSPEHFVELYNSNAKTLEGQEEIDMDELYDGIEEDVNGEMETPQNR